MARSSSFTVNPLLYETSMKFIKLCASEFEWNDLSKDLIMDVGCGAELSCSKALLELFPNVKIIISVDNNRNVFPKSKSNIGSIHFCIGNILECDSLKDFEGKMDKVLSTNTFHLIEKELAFQNIYRLLKPGGEAALYFSQSSPMNKFLKDFLEIPKYKAMLKASFNKNLYAEGSGKKYYKEMLEKTGFKHVRTTEDLVTLHVSSLEEFKEGLYQGIKKYFKIPSKFKHTFKNTALRIYFKVNPGDVANLSLTFVDYNLLGVKSMESADLKAAETSNSCKCG